MPNATAEPAGAVTRDEVLSLAEFSKRTGMGPAAIRNASRRGLIVRRVGKRSFILGRDFLDYVAEHGRPVH